jgi:hypothetical protein
MCKLVVRVVGYEPEAERVDVEPAPKRRLGVDPDQVPPGATYLFGPRVTADSEPTSVADPSPATHQSAYPEIAKLMAIAEQRRIENELIMAAKVALEHENAQLRAEREPGQWLSLRKALACLNREVGCEYETARTWCRDGLIVCYQERVKGRKRGRWMVYYPSLERHAKQKR